MHLRTDTGAAAHHSKVPYITRQRNSFSIAEKHVTTIQFDYLYPLYWKYIYPGDTISATMKIMARLQTQIAVLYDDLYLDVHAWYVPMRLIHENWARFQFNSQPLGPTQDNSSLTTPRINPELLPNTGGAQPNCFLPKSLYDYLGLKTDVTVPPDSHINNYLGRCYNFIWNENYRDQNLQNAIPCPVDDGPDNPNDFILRKRGKRHDRFTSALPWPQKGSPVVLPIGGYAPVTILGNPATPDIAISSNGNRPTFTTTSSFTNTPLSIANSAGTVGTLQTANTHPTAKNEAATFGNETGLKTTGSAVAPALQATADLNLINAFSVNQLRQSIAVQHLLEADARGGTRDVESIANRWGVQVPDYRMQRPEWQGGITFSFDGHVVPQTSETGETPQANLTQFSQAIDGLNVNQSYLEHGIFMILISARSNMTYQDGMPKEVMHETRFDFYQPEFSNLGEVAVKNEEIFFQSNTGTNKAPWAYQEYGYELRYSLNKVTAEMRSSFAQSLDMKNMAYDFSSLPALGDAFIQSYTPISRNIAVEASQFDPIELNTLMIGNIARTLPMYSVPGLTRI